MKYPHTSLSRDYLVTQLALIQVVTDWSSKSSKSLNFQVSKKLESLHVPQNRNRIPLSNLDQLPKTRSSSSGESEMLSTTIWNSAKMCHRKINRGMCLLLLLLLHSLKRDESVLVVQLFLPLRETIQYLSVSLSLGWVPCLTFALTSLLREVVGFWGGRRWDGMFPI